MNNYELARKQADAARAKAVQDNLPPERRPLAPTMSIEVRDYDAIAAEVDRLRHQASNFVAEVDRLRHQASNFVAALS